MENQMNKYEEALNWLTCRCMKTNDGLRREYLRITMTLAMAEEHFNAFKRECEDWLNNIYRDGVKRHE